MHFQNTQILRSVSHFWLSYTYSTKYSQFTDCHIPLKGCPVLNICSKAEQPVQADLVMKASSPFEQNFTEITDGFQSTSIDDKYLNFNQH